MPPESIDESRRRRFEQNRRVDPSAALEGFVPAASEPSYLATLEELVLIDLEFGWKEAAPGAKGPLVEGYLARFPVLNQREITFRLLRYEYELRLARGETTVLEEYRVRFPQWLVTGLEFLDGRHSLSHASGATSDVVPSPSDSGASQPTKADHSPDPGTVWNIASQGIAPQNKSGLAQALVAQGKLTDFQARRLLAGNGESLVLGEYVLLDEIGAGGMGCVYKAEHRRMKRIVALKMIAPAALRDVQAIRRFQREVQAAARLEHPNIVTAYDAGQAGETHFLVMQFVEGSDLSSLVKKQGPLQVEKAVDYVLQAAIGLAFAHAEGVVHRDIKPANLLLDKKGVVKILDLGLARLDSSIDALTSTEQMMGTVDFMSPEQASNSKTADARSDVYSLGCTLWYLLTGRRIYDGDTSLERVLAHREQPVPSLTKARADVPPTLDAVYARLVAKRPEARPTMAEVMQELSSFLPPRPATDASSSTIHRRAPGIDPSPAGGNRTSAALRMAGGIGIAIAAAIGVWLSVRQRESGPAESVAASEGKTAVLAVPAASKIAASSVAVNPPKSTNAIGMEFVRVPTGPAPPLAKAPFDAAQAKAHQAAWAKHFGTQVETTNSVGMQMILIPPGEFLMGSSDADVASALKIAEETKLDEIGVKRIQQERQQHLVRITQPFRLATHEVTIGQFAKFVEQAKDKTQSEEFGGNSAVVKPEEVNPDSLKLNWRAPGYAVTDDSPVTQVSWNDAVAFCNWLSEEEKLQPCYRRNGDTWALLANANGYRLPTEAEWEYACRAGTTTQFWFGDDWKEHDKYGWSKNNAGDCPRSVGLLPANPFGLYDMNGSVLEWCHDWYDGKLYQQSPQDSPIGPNGGFDRAGRGGSWDSNPAYGRSAARYSSGPPQYRNRGRGFRPALSSVAAPSSTASDTALMPSVAKPPPAPKPVGPAPPLAKAPFDAAQARLHQESWAKYLGTTVEVADSTGAKMVLIPPGEFLMGSSDQQIAAALKAAEEYKADQGAKDRIQKSERPQHRVILTKPLRMGTTEVTIGQFRKFVEASKYVTEAEQYGFGDSAEKVLTDKITTIQKQRNWRSPGYAVTEDLPATQITWNDATAYCKWLSAQEKTTYRLPSEAEWEYACRAGTTTQYSFGDDANLLEQFGWFYKNAGAKSHPVGTKSANAFGLRDMHGNFYEWCQDVYDEKWYEQPATSDPRGPLSGANRVIRGGTWPYPASYCRSAARYFNTPSSRSAYYGFRCVQVLDLPTTGDQDRAVAEWALGLGAELSVITPDKPDGKYEWQASRVDELPNTPFSIVRFTVSPSSCPDPKKFGDKAVERLIGLDKLQDVHFYSAAVTDVGAAKLAQIPTLKAVTLRDLKALSDDGVLPVLKLPNLQLLNVSGAAVTDRLLSVAAECPGLTQLEVIGCRNITPAGLEDFKKARPDCRVIRSSKQFE